MKEYFICKATDCGKDYWHSSLVDDGKDVLPTSMLASPPLTIIKAINKWQSLLSVGVSLWEVAIMFHEDYDFMGLEATLHEWR